MSVLSVQSVSYSYKTKYQTVQAVKDVSCDLSAGTFYALVGKSGSGVSRRMSSRNSDRYSFVRVIFLFRWLPLLQWL